MKTPIGPTDAGRAWLEERMREADALRARIVKRLDERDYEDGDRERLETGLRAAAEAVAAIAIELARREK